MNEKSGTGRLPSKERSRSRELDRQHNRMFSSIIPGVSAVLLVSALLVGLLPVIDTSPPDGRTLLAVAMVATALLLPLIRKAHQ